MSSRAAKGTMMANNKLRPGPHRVSELFDMNKYPSLNIIWGIYVGEGCVIGDDPLIWKRIDAHAHSLKDDEWRGWVCIADHKAVITATGRPSHTLIHELAHLELQNTAHNKKWADCVIRLGARAEANKYYKPRAKKDRVDVKDEKFHDGSTGAGSGRISEAKPSNVLPMRISN